MRHKKIKIILLSTLLILLPVGCKLQRDNSSKILVANNLNKGVLLKKIEIEEEPVVFVSEEPIVKEKPVVYIDEEPIASEDYSIWEDYSRYLLCETYYERYNEVEFSKVINPGDGDDIIIYAKSLLKELGYDGEITSGYTDDLFDYVKEFQNQMNLKSDGIIGYETLGAFNDYFVKNVSDKCDKDFLKDKDFVLSMGYNALNNTKLTNDVLTRSRTAISLRNEKVLAVAKVLYQLEYMDKYDNVFDLDFENALRTFQSDYNLTVDGVYGPETYNVMKNIEISDVEKDNKDYKYTFVIDRDSNYEYVYKGDELWMVNVIGDGKVSTVTPEGVFGISGYIENRRYCGNRYSIETNPMPYCSWIDNAYIMAAFHGTPSKSSLGTSPSGGCVRHTTETIILLGDDLPNNTLVLIIDSTKVTNDFYDEYSLQENIKELTKQ